jgi:deoxyribonuclease V
MDGPTGDPATVKIPRAPHAWRLTPKQAVAVQERLRDRVRLCAAPVPETIVGLDCAFLGEDVIAVAVVWDVGRRRVIESRGARMALRFPYVPGLLSFREVPVLLKVLRRLATPIGGILCDGQGIAHPRRLGLASHLGLIAGVPTVGCAKSRLCGTHGVPGRRRGAVAPLMDGDERIGSVLRTRDGVKPVYVSPGHLADHRSSVAWVLACGGGFRLPEPTRLADRFVAHYKKSGSYRGGLEALR